MDRCDGRVESVTGTLDIAYLRHWAAELGLTDLFAHVCRDAGIAEEEYA